MKTGVRLVDGDNELIIHPSEEIIGQSYNVASPDIREVVANRPDGDGVRDTTAYFGARAVTLELRLVLLGGAQRLALRQQEVAGVAVAYADGLTHGAELGDALEENDVHGSVPFGVGGEVSG